MNNRFKILIVLLAPLLFSCTKTEVVEVHENLIVTGNQPPDYSGVTSLQVQSYVNRLYVDLIGEQPSFEELTDKVGFLQNSDLSMESREALISELMQTEDYYENFFNYTSIQFLSGVSQSQLDEQVVLYTFIIQQAYDSGDILIAQYLEYELLKLQQLVSAAIDLQSNTININEYYKRFCNNLVYDEINMGSENFVISCFENLFGRYPIADEIENGVVMVDGGPSIVLLHSGDSKNDFLNIVINDEEFYVGRVVEQFQSLLLRNPTQIEEQMFTEIMLESGTLKALQKSITKTDEYAGF